MRVYVVGLVLSAMLGSAFAGYGPGVPRSCPSGLPIPPSGVCR